jgi:hypothetical protein
LSQPTSQGFNPANPTLTSEYGSIYSSHANFDEEVCTIFELYTEQPEHASQTEPFNRAESQPFFLRISYVHDLVPEVLDSTTETRTSIKPADDPPSYPNSILTQELSFAYACPRIRAESSINLFLHLLSFTICFLFTILQSLYSLIVPLSSELHSDHDFDTIPARS